MADKTFEAATRTLSSLIVTGRAGQKSDTPQQVPVPPYWRTESAMRRDHRIPSGRLLHDSGDILSKCPCHKKAPD